MSLFKHVFSEASRPSEYDLDVILHFQTILAYQQLCMERVNNAHAHVTDRSAHRNEAFVRPIVSFNDPESVEQHILPALFFKNSVLDLLENNHKEKCRPTNELLGIVYDDFSEAISIMKERGLLQFEGLSEWVVDQTADVNTTLLDKAETQAMDKALFSLNRAKLKLRISDQQFLEITFKAYQKVRNEMGLRPLTQKEFADIYFALISGQRARFFE